MTSVIKTFISETGARDHLLAALPTLRTLPDIEAVDALVELYEMGATAGAEKTGAVVKELGEWISRLVIAHVNRNAQDVAAVLDEFIAAHIVIKGGPNPTVPN